MPQSEDLTRAIIAALGDARRVEGGTELEFRCPSHADERPSAQYNASRGLWHCKVCGAGGSDRSLAEALGIKIERREPKATIAATYDYRAADGTLLYQAVRLIPKDFRQRRPDGAGGWVWSLKGVELVLYRLPELRAAAPGARVYVVEGEKDAESLAALGAIATTNAMGAGKWRQSYNADLSGFEVVVLPDNDKAGREHGTAVAQSLSRDGITVRVLSLAGLSDKGDVSDWIANGGSLDELERLADAAPVWVGAVAPDPAEPDALIHSFACTEAGNGELFAHLYGERARYDWKRARWLVWLGQRWGSDPTGLLYKWALESARRRARAAESIENPDLRRRTYLWSIQSESYARLSTTLLQAQKEAPIADLGEAWDQHPLLLGAENGVINLATGELRAGRPDDRITLSCGLHYDPLAAAPRWERFISEIMCGDEEMIAYLQRLVGYCLTGSTREQIWALLHGRGSNGKSTFLNVLSWLAGDYGGVLSMQTIEKGKAQAIPADMAALAGKRLVTASETSETATLNEGRIKALTGGDSITARELYARQFTYVPVLKLLVGLNHLPRVDDDSEGFWRRVHRVPFARQFEAHERQRDLDEVLRGELPGILAWAVRGAVEWNKTGLRPPDAVLLATADYRIQADPLGSFIAECCVLGSDKRAARGALYQAYGAWCDAQGYRDRDRLGAPSFGRRIVERFGLAPVKTNGARYYMGIGLLAEGLDEGRYDPPRDAIKARDAIFDKSAETISSPIGLFENESLAPLAPLCRCEAHHEDDLACEGLPFWEDERSDPHCPICHPRSSP